MAKRKLQMFRRESALVTPEMAREWQARGRACAWQGCTNACKGDLPGDWVNVLVWWSPRPEDRNILEIASTPFCTRDAVLCPEHARQLEGLLGGVDTRLDDPAGTA
jgi:hypothetical protein